MDFETFSNIIISSINASEEIGKSKISSIKEVVRNYIKPGQKIHLGFCGGFSSSLIHEIVRAYRDKKPDFHMLCLGATTLIQYMLGANLETPMIKTLTTTYAGDAYPRSSTVPIFNHQIKNGMKIEYCTVLTFPLMLLAGAMDLPWLPTNSLIGSNMEEEGYFKKISNSFFEGDLNEGRDIALVKALRPDVSIYHAWASDQYGNALFAPPYGSDIYGAYACKGPVVVTAERIVSTDYIRKHRNYTRLPGHVVSAVVKSPYDCHPSMYYGLDDEGYMEDIPFLIDFHKHNRTPQGLHDFVEEWILKTKNFNEYKEKVGVERLQELSRCLKPTWWKENLASKLDSIDDLKSRSINEFERMVLIAAEKITQVVKRKKYDLMLAGQGFSNLAAWMAKYNLIENNFPSNVVAEIGFYGYLPRPGSPFIFNITNVPTCKMTTNILEILGINLGRSNSCGVIGAAQIDRYGNINSTKIGDHHLIGSGGANDVGSQSRAREIFVVMIHGKERLLYKVPYITVPGNKVSMVITTKAILEKPKESDELVLTGIINPTNRPKEEVIEDIKKETGWDLKIAKDIKENSINSVEKVNLLRLLDPEGFFLTKK